VRSWVTGISGNRFTENLYYNQNTANLANFTPSYNGNIAGMQWNIPAEGLGYNRAYSFAYDGLNRLTAGNYTGGTTGTYNESFGYDKMGNITTLNRNESGTGLNQLTLNYTGNQLLTAYDALSVTKLYGSEAFDNKANLSTEYLYDTNGSTTYDANSGISTIQYNVLNLPNIVQFTAGHKNIYTYGADGKKLETNNYTLHSAINVPQGSISTLPSNPGDYTKVTTDYVGNMIYENGSLKEILLPEGYWQSGVYYYYLKDHLGDNRVTINSSGTVIEKSHYYPSGMRFFDTSTSNSAALPYRYNGKELEAMNGLNQYDYGARRRGAGLPPFTTLDPLAEKRPWESPYCYAGNNPINRIDPNGMKWETKEDEEYAKRLSQEMTSKINSEQKSLDKLNAKIAQNKEKGQDISKSQAKAVGMQANIDNLKEGVSELTAMGNTKDQAFTYNKIDGNVGGTDSKDGIIVMDIANNGSTSNGVHESSHGYDLWKNGRPTENTAIAGEVKAYSRQFSFDESSMPISDFGRANSLNDINHRWVLGINNGGDYLYIRFVYPNRDPKDILKIIK
jgi:RHS repeat-associated protein